MKTIVLLVVLGIVGSTSAALPIVPCSKDKMDLEIDAIHILGDTECESYPCEVKRGSNATLIITFKDVAGDPINMLNNSAYGIIATIPVKYPNFPPEDIPVCSLANDASSKCPINNGDSYTEKVVIPVPGKSVVPLPISLPVKWELVNGENKKMEGCFEVQLKLT